MSSLSDHPLYARLSHLLNIVVFAVFIVTGFMIHWPYVGMPMDFIRDLHILFLWIFLINGVIRIYWAIFGSERDYKEFLPNKHDLKSYFPQLKYYLFLGKHPALKGKYNSIQKLAYLAMFIVSAFQLVTGFTLLWPDKLSGLANFFGGLANVRSIHYLVTWVFVVIIAIHLYLVFTEARELFSIMIFGKESKKTKAAHANHSAEKGM